MKMTMLSCRMQRLIGVLSSVIQTLAGNIQMMVHQMCLIISKETALAISRHIYLRMGLRCITICMQQLWKMFWFLQLPLGLWQLQFCIRLTLFEIEFNNLEHKNPNLNHIFSPELMLRQESWPGDVGAGRTSRLGNPMQMVPMPPLHLFRVRYLR